MGSITVTVGGVVSGNFRLPVNLRLGDVSVVQGIVRQLELTRS